jgi:hypothetical protein
VVGDLAFLHDVGALLACPPPETPLVIVVADNAGGGIFDHLPIARHPTAFEPHFITRPRVDVETVGRGLPVAFESTPTVAALNEALRRSPDDRRHLGHPCPYRPRLRPGAATGRAPRRRVRAACTTLSTSSQPNQELSP